MNIQTLKQRFSRQQLFSFFLICAFPFHLWKIIMLIRDAGWITERSGTGSIIGVASLSMIYALVESLLFFLLLLILGLVIPWKWNSKRVFAILGFIALWIPIWDMASQAYRAADMANPGFFVSWLFATQHPLRYAYPLLALVGLAVIALTAAGIWLTSFNHKFQQHIRNFLERIAILSALYLVLDLVSVVVVVIRIIG
jgi:hypothetical protein